MATTTNYGWTTPDDTALVKDGAAAIRTLGSSIDTSLNTALGTKKAGLVLLNTTSFSAVSSQSINDVFSATYDQYRILLRLTAVSTDISGLSFRFRVSGSDNSTSNYSRVGYYIGSDVSTGTNVAINQAQFAMGSMDTSNPTYHLHDILISLPFTADYTQFQKMSGSKNQTGIHFTEFESNWFNATTSFTGFSFFPSTGNITGTVSTYGINK